MNLRCFLTVSNVNKASYLIKFTEAGDPSASGRARSMDFAELRFLE